MQHPAFERVRVASRAGPVVVAHRGDSRHCPENTLAAFRAARAAGVLMQELDVQATRDNTLVCLHDDSLDRTTDAPHRLGPGALVAQSDLAVVRQLDAGRWHGAAHAGERVPTLAEALAVLVPDGLAMIEHKSGDAARYVAAIHAANAVAHCILQSFDWSFVAAAHTLAPHLALAALGPHARATRLDDNAIAAAKSAGACMLHWHARAVGHHDVVRVHAAGMLLCTYTSDDDVAWAGHRAIGIDAFCTNDPVGALAAARVLGD